MSKIVTGHNVEIDRLVENVLLSVELLKFAVKSILMLALIPIYLFWKSYYNLSKKHNRAHWSYGLLGGFIYLASQFLFLFLIGLLIVLADLNTNVPDIVLSLTAIVFAASVAYGIEHLLKRNWERNPKDRFSDLLDN